ncbi:MAG: hypothetical protein HY282_11895 [Nitrospirae bacterium]|nr:hypothetical protein [Candidatus Manganitrophaceae bacterium]
MLKRSIVLLGLLAVGLFSVGVTWAEELPTLYRGIRPLGMGGAFITLSDDENAMFYNPAGLNDVSGFGGVSILNPLLEVSKNSKSLYSDLKDLDTDNQAIVADFLSKMVGEHQHVRAAALPNVFMHNFAIGVLGQGTLDMDIRNPGNPAVFTDIKLDTGLLVSGALGFFDQQLQLGATGKFIKRDGIKHVYFAPEIAHKDFDPLDQREKKSDFAFDVGTKLSLKSPLRPTFALVVQNITDLDFKELGIIPQEVNVGASINPNFWILKTTFAVEVDDLTKNADADKDLYKRTHLGAEFRFPKILALRAGLNAGYVTAGVDLDFWILSVSAATYAEEIGAFAGQRSDRRYIVQASLGF